MLDEREALGVRVVVVSFAPPPSLRAYRKRFGLDGAVLLSDAGRAAYTAFGFGRASRRRVRLDPRVWRRYAELLGRGRRPEPPGEDVLQLGGDVLCGPDGTVAWVYRSDGPEDRPAVAAIRRARMAAGGHGTG